MGGQLALLPFLLIISLSLGYAVTWDVVNKTTNPALNALPRDHVNPYSEEARTCLSPGTCVPSRFYIPNQNVFYWCGWKTVYRSLYNVNVTNKQTDSDITVTLMREEDFNGCNLTEFKDCLRVAYSTCGPKSQCEFKVNGIVFPDDLCLLIMVNGNQTKNKNRTGANIEFQFWNYYESPRYYGTVFTIILTILLFGSVLTYMGWTCWHEYHAPNDRIHEFRSLESALQTGELAGENVRDNPAAQEEQKAKNAANFSAKVSGAMDKVRSKFRRKGRA